MDKENKPAREIDPLRARRPGVEVPADGVRRLRELYEQGLVRQALDLALTFGPLDAWVGASAQIMAGRIAMNLGAPRLGRWLHYRAFRESPRLASAQAYHLAAVLDRFGPIVALGRVRTLPDAEPAPDEVTSDGSQYLLSLRARAHSMLRDFEAAEALLDEADSIDPRSPWVWTERAHLLETEDRYDEALAAARHSLELRAWYRPGIQATAHLLQLMDRDAEALALLEDASRRFESVPVLTQLAVLQIDLEEFTAARRNLDAVAALSPILERGYRDWLAGQRSRVAYHCGAFGEAAAHAREAGSEYMRKFADRLEAPGAERRVVRLPVHFVRQHHQTCVPATLSALSGYWGRPAEHLAVAEAICYDGTPAHSERHWAETNGWVVREFSVTWDASVALLDRGVPFTLTTTEATSGHLQAVIGYDRLRQTLLLRDPYQYYAGEVIAEPFLERYRAHGPRGMAMVPVGREALLDGIELPDAALYDGLQRLQRALFEHRRAEAGEAGRELDALAPGHRLALTGRRALASYDENTPTLLAVLNDLLALYPDDANLLLSKLSCLRELGRREDRLALLEAVCAKGADPVFCRQYAEDLRADARHLDEAERWSRRGLRHRPTDAYHLAGHGDLLWARRRFEDALELYRWAACVDDKKESPARSYFSAARQLKQTADALDLLRRRFERYGRRSAWPGMTYFEALQQLDDGTKALEVLERALAWRGEDGELLLFAARSYARLGRLERAREMLVAAEGRAQPIAALRTAAEVAQHRLDSRGALSLWLGVLELDPLAMDAHRAVAVLLAELEGRTRALAHLESVVERFPHHYGLLQLFVGWLEEEGAEMAEPALRRLVSVHPADAWSWRELAVNLGRQGRVPEALEAAGTGLQLDPVHPAGYAVRGDLRLRQGDRAGARGDFEQALRLSVDFDYAMTALMRTCVSLEERRAALTFIERELIRQTVFGDGLLAFRDVARGIQAPEELLKSLRLALSARPDLWHAWSAVTLQLVDLQRWNEAEAIAREATARFPLLPRLWLDRALVCQGQLDAEGEAGFLRQALEINSSYAHAAQRLSALHERAGDFAAARKVLEEACVAGPLEATNHGCLADLLWKQGEKEAAVARLQRALLLNPHYDWAWRTLRGWAVALGQPDLAAGLARDLAKRRPGEARPWLLLAETLIGVATPEARSELESALERAIALQPRNVAGYDLKAEALVAMGRFDEALAACEPAAWPEGAPAELRARAAWVEAERGNVRSAVQRMTKVVADNPSLAWGWHSLADWHWRLEEHDDAIRAAQKFAELSPLNPSPLGYLADLKLKNGDRPGAKKELQRAMALDPSYAYAGMNLFDLELEDGNLDEAAGVLNVLRQQVGGDFVEAREAQLAAQQGRWVQVEEIFRRLCGGSLAKPWPIVAVAEAYDRFRRGDEADGVLKAALAAETCSPVLGEVWVRRAARRSRWWHFGLLRRLKPRAGMARAMAAAWVEAMGEAIHDSLAKHGLRPPGASLALWWLVRRERDWLSADDQTWGAVGYALANLRRPAATVRWLASWREHPNAQPWMLSNLVFALRNLGRDAEADEVCRAAMRLPMRDHTSNDFVLWLALEAALGGNRAAAREALADLRETDFTPNLQKVWVLVTALLAVVEAAPAERRTAFKAEQARLNEAFPGNNLGHQGKALRRAFRRCLSAMAAAHGGWGPVGWSWWKLYWPLR